ncbi:7975_t:CDS:2 [Dentiscutata erythropus]|uniref:7975_t:CDS:1 n=1 Tax=Dentiscutata erythropus TaxID=1348616 RepID=A0A9N9GN01_9GLOM|nr:7975_t:CDS:2 [Dentiscutata erythropus]
MLLPLFSDTKGSNIALSMTSTSSTTNKNNVELVYCKICKHSFAGSRQTSYLYTCKDSN